MKGNAIISVTWNSTQSRSQRSLWFSPLVSPLSHWQLRSKWSLKDAPRSKDTFQKIMWLLSWLLGNSLRVLVNILHYKCWNFRHGCFCSLVLRKKNQQKEQPLKPGTWPGAHNETLLVSSWTWAMPWNANLRASLYETMTKWDKTEQLLNVICAQTTKFPCLPLHSCKSLCFLLSWLF